MIRDTVDTSRTRCAARARARIWPHRTSSGRSCASLHNHLYEETGPKGNNPLYEPANGGTWSPQRYTTTCLYDSMEGDPATNGVGALASRWGISLAGAVCCLGDMDGDGRQERAMGRVIRVTEPSVLLAGASRQAAIEGDTSQDIVTTLSYDDFGDLVRVVDPEGNVHRLVYNPQTDLDGDGVPLPPLPDGRTLDATGGGYLAQITIDSDDGNDAQQQDGLAAARGDVFLSSSGDFPRAAGPRSA